MNSMVKNQATIGCLVSRTVLGRSGQQFQREVERLIRHNGPEWVVDRFKSLWTAANHLRNGDRDAARSIYQEKGIAYHKHDLTPKGPFRPAVRGYILARRPSVIKRYAAVLRYYTGFRLSSLSFKQGVKAYQAITAPSEGSERGARMASTHLSWSKNPVISGLRTREGQSWIPKMSSRYADGLRATSAYFSQEKLPRQLRGEPYASMTLSFLTNSYVPEVLNSVTPMKEFRDILRDQDPNWDLKPVGRITALQEQGAKARVVAVPSAHLQLAFMPLHNRLADIAEHAFPTQSVVKDQQRGVYGVLRHLQEGKEAYSVDLSSATDRFPRSYSLEVLRTLGMANYAEALRDVCENKEWDSPWGPVSYGTGQPMGLYGSFPLFHLSNLLVCENAEREAELFFGGYGKPLDRFQNGSTFYVIGDDVVFSDRRVMEQYRSTMEELDVPISEHKSFSGKLVEFAGFMVTESSNGFVAFRPYKVPDKGYVSNPIDFLSALGSRAASISPYWRRQWDLYKVTTGSRGLDLSPLVPDKTITGPNPFRGDSRTLVGISQALTSLMGDRLPDVSGSTRVNTIPAFHERGVFDFYGFNPDELKAQEKVRTDLPLGARVTRKIREDPLMKEAKASLSSGYQPSRLIKSPPRASQLTRSQPTDVGPEDGVKEEKSPSSPIHRPTETERKSPSRPSKVQKARPSQGESSGQRLLREIEEKANGGSAPRTSHDFHFGI